MRVGIRGAGLMGRCLALALRQRGHGVVCFDVDPTARTACAWTGAGMLSPASELDGGEALVYELGRESMGRWLDLVAGLEVPVRFDGTLVVAHPGDRLEFERFERRVRAGGAENAGEVERVAARSVEPGIGLAEGLFMKGEGQVDNRAFLEATQGVLEIRSAAEWPEAGVEAEFDWTVDCRGLGARDVFPSLRGVRGELMYVEAPEVRLGRPVRLLHPRYPLYIVPRDGGRFVVGASQIESEDRGPISVRTALELLSAAYAVHTGFAEGRIVETSVNLRPAFPDHLPRVVRRGRWLGINGLFRHGFLLAPGLAEFACGVMEGRAGELDSEWQKIFTDEGDGNDDSN